MKKTISLLLLLALTLSIFAGCKNGDDNVADVTSDLESAKAYLQTMYDTAGKDGVSVLTKDLDLLSSVTVAGVSYSIDWNVSITEGASDSAKLTESSKDNHVLLDINETPESDILFTATATIKDAAGNTVTVSFNYKVVASATAGMSNEDIVELAYGLAEGDVMEGAATLTANIVRLKTPFDKEFGNITIVVAVPGLEDKPIECYRMVGDKVSNDLCIGDTVTVTGTLKNYNGTIEFDAGCTLDKVVSCGVVKPTDSKLIVDEAFALAAGDSLKYFCTLSGTVKSIDSEYSTQYNNISITIVVEGSTGTKDLVCYRMKGAGADNIAVGDTVTVTGIIKNYVSSSSETSTVEFDSGCVLDALVKGDGSTTPDIDVPVEKPSTQTGIVDAAYALAEDASLPYDATLTGKVTKINTAFDEEFGNITVTMAVKNRESKPIKCYRLVGKGVEKIAVGDTITVTGTIKNYKGTVEFVYGCTLDKHVPIDSGNKLTDPKEIVDAAYALDKNGFFDYEVTLTGKIVQLKTPYDSQYKNMTVVIAVSGREDKPIECFRMIGDKVSNKLCIGDKITVTGILKNYNGTIEFDANCKMTKLESCGIKVPTDSKKIVDEAFALAENESLKYFVTLTGKVTEIDQEFNSQYKNISVIIEVESSSGTKALLCYRMKATSADDVKVGDKISVTGLIKNYKGTIEFDAGCTFTN